jgi:hypothetical protein
VKSHSSRTALTGDPAVDWHFREIGAQVMIVEPKSSFGHASIHDAEDTDLILVSRSV